MNKNLVICALGAMMMVAAGCATQEPSAANENVSAREYPTGSSIPRKRTPNSDEGEAARESLDRARQQMPSEPRGGIPGSRPGG